MEKMDLTAKAGSRALSLTATAGVRQVFPGRDALDDAPESPWVCAEFDHEASDWPEVEKGAGYAGSGCGEQTDDSLAPDVETEINLLVRGVSYLQLNNQRETSARFTTGVFIAGPTVLRIHVVTREGQGRGLPA